MKKITLLFLMLLAAMFFVKAADAQRRRMHKHKIKKSTVIRKQANYGEIPITAILAIPENITVASRYQQLKESGITQTYYSFSNNDQVQKALDVAQQVGLKVFVACPELTKDPEGTVRRFMNHPALAGYFVADEPGKGRFKAVGDLVRRIKAIDSEHICYVNLFPNYQEQKYLGADNYDDYINSFVDEVPSQVLSFDNYPITGPNKESVRPLWYKNLATIAKVSKRTGKPFWGFALTVEQPPFPRPTLGALKLQVFSNLAYGAQGIEYFTYWTPSTSQFRSAVIAKDGKPTDVYNAVKQVNSEIKALSKVFAGAKMVRVMHTNNIPTGEQSMRAAPGPVTQLKTDGIGALVSLMENDGNSYLVVVNHDFTSPINLTIGFKQQVSRIKTDGSTEFVAPGVNTVSIDAGDVAIYSWPK